MPVRPLPPKPDLRHLKSQAKELIKARRARDMVAAQRIREFHPRHPNSADEQIFLAAFSLADAQLTIARESGFPSWPHLKAHVEKPATAGMLHRPHHERIEAPDFRRAVELLDAGDAAGLRELLSKHPNLVHQHVTFEGGNYFRSPALLQFAAENPVRHGTMSARILDVVKVLLEAGSEQADRNETLMLVSTGSVAREQGKQNALIDLLCEHGADPDSALEPAAVLFELPSARRLLERGASMTLPVAAALGRSEEFHRLLPCADERARHLGLALAAQYGRCELVRTLLDAGENPDRFNPAGGHSHSTPLHQAAGQGHLDVVRLLVERGASLDIKDVMWHATPAEWAKHEGRADVASYLLEAEKQASGQGR